MRRELVLLIVALGFCISVARVDPCEAQEGSLPYRWEVFGTAGLAGIWSDESHLGNGFDYGGGVGLRLSRRFGLEFQAERATVSKSFASGVEFEGENSAVSGTVHICFPVGRFEPYVFGGLGYASLEETSTFTEEAETYHSTTNVSRLEFGGGIRIFLSSNWSMRPEFRMALLNEVRGTVSVGYHW